MAGFQARSHRYSIDIAPTARARCRGCRKPIAKGLPRLVICAFVRPHRSTRFVRHIGCIGEKLAADVARAHGSMERVPLDGGMGSEAAARVRATLLHKSATEGAPAHVSVDSA